MRPGGFRGGGRVRYPLPTATLVALAIGVLVVGVVVFVVAQTVVGEQAAALDACSPDCDLGGPLGWPFDGSASGWLAVGGLLGVQVGVVCLYMSHVRGGGVE